ncbi:MULTISPECIES: MarR family winged helix-turn-helix transcriptional regulator [unclassified Streptomyces]|uniref:MarR family winged helix-turn-helix transcriptional regulator n=1 Tax=unclassified Streptomyces TaxID=2593676 RepID=UPI002258C02E|nr:MULTISPECIES: MarR family transcriptional regulator [unclassified Streptomyces]MCX5052348.1 MarR family transcriptional regulator [Streptomyces sp. NBC_00474]MCX5064094.1 MarR family transcriptional regulator [Streptomyces sp. NBC_00452]MCX5251515.1 MarR family transcriptional regulator [Streptomyces sp. NBC_00201]MCX5294561.1 MarR family transcriptional regulator [Streptomyces sp. NBC_00183]
MSPPPLPEIPDTPASDEVIEIERALTRITYLSTRARQHDRLMALAGVPLDRAAVALLRQVADSEPLRPGELANRLGVEASHVTRTVQQLQKSGYVTRVPDPDDRRAQRIQLTDAGQQAIVRVRDAGSRGMQLALSDWKPEELRQLATLFHRMVDDFLSHSFDDDAEEQPVAQAGTA